MANPYGSLLASPVKPDWEAFCDCIMRKGTPSRVHYIELFLDREVQDDLVRAYGLAEGIDADDPHWELRRQINLQRFLGYDYVRQGVDDWVMPLNKVSTADTAELGREGGRTFTDEHKGPITSWDEFEAYPWPELTDASTRSIEWYQEHLPDDMCIVGSGGFGHFAELLTWLMGYESLCFGLYDQRDLVEAIAAKLLSLYEQALARILQFDVVKIVWGSDDMGFNKGTLISPDDTREYVLPGHKLMAEMSHAACRPYILHSCGNLAEIMDDLIDDVGIDAKHSFEDTIEDVRELKSTYGRRIGLLGGIDVDFLCRADEDTIRARVRETLDVCMPGGGYCLGTGNSVANYIPVRNYLAMLDEGRRWRS